MILAFGRTSNNNTTNQIYLDLYDRYKFKLGTPFFSYNPLIKITSQETSQEKFFVATTVDSTYAQRYLILTWTASGFGVEVPAVGLIQVGTKEFPYGIYDISIYENASSGNLNPTGTYGVLYMGLMSLSPTTSNSTITWNEYEQENENTVYVSNTYI